MKLDIYTYTKAHDFLKDAFNAKKVENSQFSMRSLAMHLDMKSHGPITAMLSGQRGIPKKYIPKLAKLFKLNVNAAKYFEAMIDLANAESIEEKKIYEEKMQAYSPNPLRKITEIESYDYLSNPLHFFILEMSELKNFEYNLGKIKRRLRVNVSLKDIEDAVLRLKDLGLIEVKNNQLIKTHKHLSFTKDTLNQGVQKYHQNMAMMAMQEISKQAIELREYNSFTFNIDPEKIPEIKMRMKKVCDEIIREFESESKKGEETYHLNMHFFAITQK